MKYKVTANIIEARANEFFNKLNSGEIASQKPDGAEVVASMKRAIKNDDNSIEWYEECFCSTPLDHERKTVFDFYFTDFQVVEVDSFQELQGESFWKSN